MSFSGNRGQVTAKQNLILTSDSRPLTPFGRGGNDEA
jgi:hypothetical protein